MVKKNRFHESGQALLIILLVMTVGLTIGLASVSRSSTDIKISTQMEDSSRAFVAAEAGIEAALKGEAGAANCANPPTNYTAIGSSSSSYCFNSAAAGGGTQFRVNNVSVGDTYTIWLVEHNADGTLNPTDYYNSSTKKIKICWEKNISTNSDPALEITLIYQTISGGSYQVFRGSYDPNNIRAASNHFINQATATDCGLGFGYGIEFNYSTVSPFFKTFALRLRPFYSTANIGVQAVNPIAGGTITGLPTQGLNITSTGTSGESTRKVTVTRTYPVLPAIFDYVLFSGGSLTK